MTTPEPTTPSDLPDAIAAAQAQMTRVDAKASMLLAGALTSVSVGVALIAKTRFATPITIGAVITVALIGVAVAFLITAVRPALGGNHGFIRWANTPSTTALLADFARTDRETAAYHATTLLSLSRSVRRKYLLIRHATDLLRAALVSAALTAALAAVL